MLRKSKTKSAGLWLLMSILVGLASILLFRFWGSRPLEFETMRYEFPVSVVGLDAGGNVEIKNFEGFSEKELKAFGIRFPDGSEISRENEFTGVRMTNTMEEHEKFQKFLDDRYGKYWSIR